MDEIGNSLKSNEQLKTRVLFDYLRGTRGGKNSTLELISQKKLTGLDVRVYFLFKIKITF